jgi:hypothetical protein
MAHGQIGKMVHYSRRLSLLLGDLGLLQRLTRGRKVATCRLLRQGLLGEGIDLGARLVDLVTALRDRYTGGEQRCRNAN